MTMWFDVLPVHPPPLPLESFTGYLVRLAEANHLKTKSALASMTHPDKRWKGTWSDYPLHDLATYVLPPNVQSVNSKPQRFTIWSESSGEALRGIIAVVFYSAA